MKVNLTTLADLLGVTRPTIRARIDRGMPYESKGSQGNDYVFDTVQVIEWHIAHAQEDGFTGGRRSDPTLKELARRKLQAETEMVERRRDKEKAKVVLREDAEVIVLESVEELTSCLRGVAQRIAPKVVGKADEEVIKARLEDEIDKTLTNLQDYYLQEIDQ